MKFKAYITINYRKRKLLKPYIIDKVIGETHAKKVLNDNLRVLLPGRRYKLIGLEKIND